MYSGAFAAGTTTATQETDTTVSVAAPTDNSSSATAWTTKEWGELGVAKLKSAPFPDDTRTTGYQSRNGNFPYAGHYDDPSVAIAIPKNYRRGHTADLIVHFHGWSNEAAHAIASYHLGEQLTSSAKNGIILLPQGPKNAKDSSIGKLQKPGGLRNFVNEAMQLLIAEGKLDAGTTVGTVILSGHSGGYFPIGRCLAVGGMDDTIKETWLWDASYGEWENYAQFVRAGKNEHTLRSLFTDHLEDANVHIVSLLSLAGERVALFDEDDITTRGTSQASFEKSVFHSKNAAAGQDEIDDLLKSNRLFFMHTHLAHDRVIDQNGYFEKFARCSHNLEPR